MKYNRVVGQLVGPLEHFSIWVKNFIFVQLRKFFYYYSGFVRVRSCELFFKRNTFKLNFFTSLIFMWNHPDWPKSEKNEKCSSGHTSCPKIYIKWDLYACTLSPEFFFQKFLKNLLQWLPQFYKIHLLSDGKLSIFLESHNRTVKH